MNASMNTNMTLTLELKKEVRRYVKSEYAAQVAAEAGLRVSPCRKEYFVCCRQCGDAYAIEEGWVVESTNSTLRGLGLMSSSSRNCSW